MILDNLSDLLQRGLEYAWDCEHLLVKHLPNMSEAASDSRLKTIFDLHVAETKGHVYRLEQIFTRLDRSPAGEKHEPIRILVDESERMIHHLDRSPLMDAALIFSANQIEHYEIGLYQSLAAFARTLGLNAVGTLLDEILSDEKSAELALTSLADSSINQAASGVSNPPPFALI
jgi:ferritin-like metal-binding protein YciE